MFISGVIMKIIEGFIFKDQNGHKFIVSKISKDNKYGYLLNYPITKNDNADQFKLIGLIDCLKDKIFIKVSTVEAEFNN